MLDDKLANFVATQNIDLDFDYEVLLEWAVRFRDLKVVWGDEFVDGNGKIIPAAGYASWLMLWKHGVIDLGRIPKDDEASARKAAALFIALWARGISPGIAVRCAVGYVRTFTTSKVE